MRVANGGHVTGGAADTTAAVARLGYQTQAPVNAASVQARTVVYFQAGYAADGSVLAAAISGTLGVHPTVLPASSSLPLSSPNSADILVVLGTDAPL